MASPTFVSARGDRLKSIASSIFHALSQACVNYSLEQAMSVALLLHFCASDMAFTGGLLLIGILMMGALYFMSGYSRARTNEAENDVGPQKFPLSSVGLTLEQHQYNPFHLKLAGDVLQRSRVEVYVGNDCASFDVRVKIEPRTDVGV